MSKSDPLGTAYVGRVDGSIPSHRLPTEAEAQEYLYNVLAADDPEGLAAGHYFIDVVTGESESG